MRNYLTEIYLTSTVILLLILLFLFEPAILPFFIASAVAYVFYPVFIFFNNLTGDRRRFSAFLTLLTMFLVLSFALFILIPSIIEQIQSFLNFLPTLFEKLDSFFIKFFGKHFPLLHPFKLTTLKEIINEIYQKFGTIPIANLISKLFSGFFSAISIVINLIVIPFLTYYLLINSRKIVRIYLLIAPCSIQKELKLLLQKVHSSLSSYLIGQMAVALFVGLYIAIGLLFVGIKYSLLIGFVAGVLNMIPYVGFFSGLVPSLLLAIFDNGTLEAVIGVLTVFLTEVGLENLIYPLIMSRTTGVNPILILLSIFLGGYLGGLLGVVIGVPLAVILVPIFESFIEKKERLKSACGSNG